MFVARRTSQSRSRPVKGKIYPKGSGRPANVPNIEAYEKHRAQNPLRPEAWHRAESDLARGKQKIHDKKPVKGKLTGPKIPKKLRFDMKIGGKRANCSFDFQHGLAIVVIQHPQIPKARAEFGLGPKRISKGLGKAISSLTLSRDFERTYGDYVAALELAWAKALSKS